MKPLHLLNPENLDAFIFDMDGVLTRTARLHARAWKQAFDWFLKRRDKGNIEPFDIDSDYRDYVDGKSRYAGIQSFLGSREIELPFGNPDDSPNDATVMGLGKRKNRQFLERLEQEGVEVYHSAIDFIRGLKTRGIKVAVISASRNCRRVLEAAGLSQLFDVRVDGIDLEESGLKSKPAPDIFLKAAGLLGTDPHRTGVVEDALAGIEAAAAAGFHPIIALIRRGDSFPGQERGADIVVRDLCEVKVGNRDNDRRRPIETLPSALKEFGAMADRLQELDPIFFLDYDGTLTPIVDHPDQAVLSQAMKTLVSRLASRRIVAVISGRDLRDVRRLVGLPNLYYAGSHGFEISEPGQAGDFLHKGGEYLDALREAEDKARKLSKKIPGLVLERKRFSLAVHYRQVKEKRVPGVESLVDGILSGIPGLKKSAGKKVFEIRPDTDWDKGKALDWLLDVMELKDNHAIPLYIGDDLTDEDAFRVVQDTGIGIVVGRGERPTYAAYRLEDPGEVRMFLLRCLEILRGGQP